MAEMGFEAHELYPEFYQDEDHPDNLDGLTIYDGLDYYELRRIRQLYYAICREDVEKEIDIVLKYLEDFYHCAE